MFKRKNQLLETEKSSKEINIFALLIIILAITFVATFFIPSGEYNRAVIDDRTVIVADSFKYIESAPLSIMNFLTSIPEGLVSAAGIIFFVLIIGGVFSILNATGATESLIMTLAKKFGNNEKWLIPIFMLFFSLNGALLGAYEEALPYVLILVPLVLAMGFDTMTGVAIVFVGVSTGFMSAIMNPFTIGVAQRIAELPLYSGLAFRVVLFIVLYLVGVWYVHRHAMKVKRDPSLGIYGTIKGKSREEVMNSTVKITTRQKIVLYAFVLNLAIIAYGVTQHEWYFYEIAGDFLVFGVVVGFIGKLTVNQISDEFIKGAATLLSGALIIGLAKSIVILLEQGHVMDTILYGVSNAISSMPTSITAIGMLVLQFGISFIVPSGSGMAALTMPIMSPLADIVGVTRQTAVLAYQLGDGISNLIVPGVAVAAISMVGISYVKWVRWLLPLMALQILVAIVAILIANAINYGPF